MRRDSHAELTILGTFAIHVAVAIIAVALVRAYPADKDKPAPSIELVDLEPPPPEPPPPPPPPPAAEEPKAPAPEPPPEPVHAKVAIRSTPPVPAHTEPPPQPQTPAPASPDSGGGPVVHIDNLAPDAKGSVPVQTGPSSPHVGRGGSGGGTGAGSGQGSSDVPPPVSVAMIKKAAMPRGDFGYMDASKDYPSEARQLGIEGDIQVRLVVDDKGAVKSAILRTKLGHGLDELALARAKRLQFDPAVDTDNRAVASVVVWTFHMTLPK